MRSWQWGLMEAGSSGEKSRYPEWEAHVEGLKPRGSLATSVFCLGSSRSHQVNPVGPAILFLLPYSPGLAKIGWWACTGPLSGLMTAFGAMGTW